MRDSDQRSRRRCPAAVAWLLGPCFSTTAVRSISASTLTLMGCAIFHERGACMAYPANFRYTREHEWISVDGNIGTVGITDYAQNSLGDIVYVDAPKVGDSVSA